MSTDRESLQQRASRFEQEQEQLRLLKLSNKNIPLAVVISLLIPIGGYIYTGRWKAFLILMVTSGLVGCAIGATSRSVEEAVERVFIVGSFAETIIAPIDNGLAIQRAKEKMKELP